VPNVVFDRTLQQAVRASKLRVEHYAEYIEDNRFPGEDQSRILHDYLVRKYAGRRVDVVIAFAQPALDYLLKYRSDLFPQVPIVYYTIGRPVFDDPSMSKQTTGAIVDNAYRKSIDLAMMLHPDTKEVIVIASTPGATKREERTFQREMA